MKKFLLLASVGLLLVGCAQLQQGIQTVQTVVAGASASVQNPVTKKMLYEAEAAVSVAVAGLVQYRRACLAGQADTNCRANIRAMQVYTRKIPPVLKNLRAFVKNNDQVNAVVAYNTVRQLLSDFKATATAAGAGV